MQAKFTPIVVKAPQRSPDWFRARLGNVTASNVKYTMGYYKPTQGELNLADSIHEQQGIDEDYCREMRDKYPAEYCLEVGIDLRETEARAGYRQGLVSERFTGISAEIDKYITKSMLWGQQQELPARYAYQERYGHIVQPAPLLLHPEWLCGASSDGFVIDVLTGELGNLEIKCLEPKNHLYKMARSPKMPDDFWDQVQMQMWIADRDWTDFVGYDSRYPDGLHIFVKRVRRDDFYIENVLTPSLKRFLDECDHDERQFYAIMKAQKEKAEAKAEVEEEIREVQYS